MSNFDCDINGFVKVRLNNDMMLIEPLAEDLFDIL